MDWIVVDAFFVKRSWRNTSYLYLLCLMILLWNHWKECIFTLIFYFFIFGENLWKDGLCFRFVFLYTRLSFVCIDSRLIYGCSCWQRTRLLRDSSQRKRVCSEWKDSGMFSQLLSWQVCLLGVIWYTLLNGFLSWAVVS